MADTDQEQHELIAKVKNLTRDVPPGVDANIPCEEWTSEELKACCRQAAKPSKPMGESKKQQSFEMY